MHDEADVQQRVFAALADPMRRRLLADLAAASPKTASQLAQGYPITRQGVLKHLTILEAAGLVTVEQAGREMRYSLQTEPLGELAQWVGAINAQWEQRMQRLKRMLEQATPLE